MQSQHLIHAADEAHSFDSFIFSIIMKIINCKWVPPRSLWRDVLLRFNSFIHSILNRATSRFSSRIYTSDKNAFDLSNCAHRNALQAFSAICTDALLCCAVLAFHIPIYIQIESPIVRRPSLAIRCKRKQ